MTNEITNGQEAGELLLTFAMSAEGRLSADRLIRRSALQQSRSTRAYEAARTRARHCLESDPIVRKRGRDA